MGFCGFEVEQGEKRVYLCFLTGSLHRERIESKNESIVKEEQVIRGVGVTD